MDFLKKNKDGLYVSLAEELKVLIPAYYFDGKTAIWMGDKVMSLAVVSFEVRMGENTKPRLFSLDYPIALVFRFEEKELVTKSVGKEKPKQYYSLKISKGSVVIESQAHIKSVESTIAFMDLFNAGKLNENVPYTSIPSVFKSAATINDMSLGITSVFIEAMVGEMARSAGSTDIPYRMTAKTKEDKGYVMWGVKTLAQNSSVFSAMAFENIKLAIQTSIRKTRNNDPQWESPVEKTIHY